MLKKEVGMSILLQQEKVISSAEMYKFLSERQPETRWQRFKQWARRLFL